ncbi:PLP-dependent aminotransferase family protein [Roseobacter sp. EG26]|uniref:MocR-like pyridoxine biosynthesis transcription factor PdxR n=1 Tax=Roseobacter sp. EG26 TaxID=3412477 RepID=UPI003CE585F3
MSETLQEISLIGHPAALLNWLEIDREKSAPLYDQISGQIRVAISLGRLSPGTVLPASRVLSRELGVSRITTLKAYEQLTAEGFLEARRGVGTRVTEDLSGTSIARLAGAYQTQMKTYDNKAKHLLKLFDTASTSLAFQPGIPAFDAFPHGVWSRVLSRQALQTDADMLDYAHTGGYVRLREQLAFYLRSSRGVECDPEQVIVVTSVRSAIATASAVLWKRGAVVAVEDPGYTVARECLTQSGCKVLPIPADAKGLQVGKLLENRQDCAGVYLTAAHHWPTGVTLAADRRVKLLDWAIQKEAWIIEDDYDSEFRFDSPPLGTLYALGSGRSIYVGTFSKTLAPSIRTAYLVVPHEMIPCFERDVFFRAVEPALHVQAALSEFMADGRFTRHIGRMRKLYARRRQTLADALRSRFGSRLDVVVPAGGLQLIAHLPVTISAQQAVLRAAEIGIFLRDISGCYIREQPNLNALHIGFAAVPEDQIGPKVDRLAHALGDNF